MPAHGIVSMYLVRPNLCSLDRKFHSAAGMLLDIINMQLGKIRCHESTKRYPSKLDNMWRYHQHEGTCVVVPLGAYVALAHLGDKFEIDSTIVVTHIPSIMTITKRVSLLRHNLSRSY